jgi:hypothetical protein
MITLKKFMELAEYRITEGSDYHANIRGLYMLSSWNGKQNGWSFDIAFDPKTQRVYLAEANDMLNNRAYRLKDPELDVDKQAWDGVDYVDLEVDDDFIQKFLAIRAGKDYDTRVSVPLDFSDEELLKYMKAAHEQDITFNEFVTRALTRVINTEIKYPLDTKKVEP